ncbi:MAG: family 2 glycosyl transferase [Eubacteriales bacterium]
MKKFIIVVSIIVILMIAFDFVYYHLGWYIDIHPGREVMAFIKTDGKKIYKQSGSGYEEFEIKGVNMGSGIPGEWATDFEADKETYLRWFSYIKDMGANTIRIYTIQSEIFYKAFYEYNKDNSHPLYMIHGVWVNDYIQHSHRDAFDHEFLDPFLKDCKTVIDIIHGKKKVLQGSIHSAGYGTYKYDVSPWVIGYILGVEWEDVTVAYTDEKYSGTEGYTSYTGDYMYTAENASPFEVMLATVGDYVIGYETSRYKQQRLIAFSNWPTTDPFTYPELISDFFMKCARVDVEHIKTTDKFVSGQFASYHVYPYFPDYLSYIDDWSPYLGDDVTQYTDNGNINTYSAYLAMLTTHHSMPVIISEYGVSTGRGMAQRDMNTGRNQGKMSESEQGQALVDCYNDIISSGCAGSCLFTWQDEWFKRTWNTMYAVDLKRTPYWSDYQTNEQYFGLLSFDPGDKTSVCYVDGNIQEWSKQDIVSEQEDMSVSMKYDEKFVYFLVYKKNLSFGIDILYIPIDTTQKTGSSYCRNQNVLFDRAVDFLITIKSENDSRIQVQERYDALRSTYAQNVYDFDIYEKSSIPDKDSSLFVNIDMILQTATALIYKDMTAEAEVYETGLLTYGNANPENEHFNSLADFICSGDYIEIKLPWQLMNFADPSEMKIHDDYYDGKNYGVSFIAIDFMYVGIGSNTTIGRIQSEPFELKGWGNQVTWHERLKSSYYILKKQWNDN